MLVIGADLKLCGTFSACCLVRARIGPCTTTWFGWLLGLPSAADASLGALDGALVLWVWAVSDREVKLGLLPPLMPLTAWSKNMAAAARSAYTLNLVTEPYFIPARHAARNAHQFQDTNCSCSSHVTVEFIITAVALFSLLHAGVWFTNQNHYPLCILVLQQPCPDLRGSHDASYDCRGKPV